MLYASGKTSEIRIIPDAIMVRRERWSILDVFVSVRRSPINLFQFCESQNQNKRVRKKGRNERRTISPSCPTVVAFAALRPCRHTLRCIMSYLRNNFMRKMLCSSSKEDDLDNLARGSSSAGDNTGSSSQPPSTSTSRRHAQSRLLELEHHVAVNGRIPMTIAPIRCSLQPGDRHVRAKDISIAALSGWTLAENTLRSSMVTFRHFKKYNDLEEARANPPNVLVGRHEDWHFLCDHYMCIPGIIIAAGQSCFYNDSTSSLSKKGSRSIVWSCFEKHMFESGRPCRRSQRMCRIKCWNSSPSLLKRPWLGTQAEGPQDDECKQLHDVMVSIGHRKRDSNTS
uniref:CACTA en-spm transposon protein n=1 Tax=Cucumis melo TaxID=3656 RepID=A0A9I9CHT6_CUCME